MMSCGPDPSGPADRVIPAKGGGSCRRPGNTDPSSQQSGLSGAMRIHAGGTDKRPVPLFVQLKLVTDFASPSQGLPAVLRRSYTNQPRWETDAGRHVASSALRSPVSKTSSSLLSQELAE